MALDTTVQALLDSFADSQTALRLPTLPLAQSNPKIGTAIATALAAAQSAATASGAQAYVAGDATDWATAAPTTVKAALDRLADAVHTLLTTPVP